MPCPMFRSDTSAPTAVSNDLNGLRQAANDLQTHACVRESFRDRFEPDLRSISPSAPATRHQSTLLTMRTVRAYGFYMRAPRNLARSALFFGLAVSFLLLTTNAYACVIPLYGWGQAAMQACGSSQMPPTRDFCDPFKNLGFHAAPPKLPPLVLQHQLGAIFGLPAWMSRPVSFCAVEPALEQRPCPDVLLCISILRI